jgi:hypothetical protein
MKEESEVRNIVMGFKANKSEREAILLNAKEGGFESYSDFLRVIGATRSEKATTRDRNVIEAALSIISGLSRKDDITGYKLAKLGLNPEDKHETWFTDIYLKHRAIEYIVNHLFPPVKEITKRGRKRKSEAAGTEKN